MRRAVVLFYAALIIVFASEVSAEDDTSSSSWCGTLMCVTATANGSTITYELKALNQLGWMSIGFGPQMNDTPLVIMWPNEDGSVTLSQRQASGHTAPVPVTSPPRTATVSSLTDLSDETSPVLAFDIPQDAHDDGDETMIWAFGVTRPDPPADADIVQHLDAGAFVLEARKHGEDGDGDDVSSSATPSTSSRPTSSSLASSSNSGTVSPSSVPPGLSATSPAPPTSASSLALSSSIASTASLSLSSTTTGPLLSPSPTLLPDTTSNLSVTHAHTLMVAHAVLSFLGFAFFLPLSALFVRWSRTFTSNWRRVHWVSILTLAAPCMFVGWLLGPILVSSQGHHHVVNEHQICGVALFALCLVQMSLGALVHLQQPKDGRAHPPRNILHIVLGLFVIGFAFFETKTGIMRDRLLSDDTKKILTILCILWAIVVAAAYLIGLMFLRKQLHQERLGWHLQLASRPQTRSSPPISERSINHSAAPTASHSSRSRLLRWIHSRVDDSHHSTRRSSSHQSAESSSVPEVRPQASVVTLVEMRELQSIMPITVLARDTVPCNELVD